MELSTRESLHFYQFPQNTKQSVERRSPSYTIIVHCVLRHQIKPHAWCGGGASSSSLLLFLDFSFPPFESFFDCKASWALSAFGQQRRSPAPHCEGQPRAPAYGPWSTSPLGSVIFFLFSSWPKSVISSDSFRVRYTSKDW